VVNDINLGSAKVWKEIEKSETLAKLFPEPPIVAFRRPKIIKDALVRAAVSRPSSTVGQCKPCGDKLTYVLRPADVTVNEVNHIRCFAINIAKYLILLSRRLAMEHLCVLQLETALATLVTTWFTLADCRTGI
jgi:hypothetical protein